MEAMNYSAKRTAMSAALTIANRLGHPGRYSDRKRDQDPSYVPSSAEHDALVGGYEAAKSLWETRRLTHPYHDVLRLAIRESKIRRGAQLGSQPYAEAAEAIRAGFEEAGLRIG